MTILEDKKVTTRKKHYCYACHRGFEKGSILNTQVNVGFDGICRVYWCETCDEIMKKHTDYVLDEVEGHFPDACVLNIPVNYFARTELQKDWTPEMILESLNDELK